MIMSVIQIIGIMIPFAGTIALLRRSQQSESAVRLLLATVGCMIMNSGYLLVTISNIESAAMTALKVEYMGSAMFYFFLMRFLISYLKLNIPQFVIYIWGAVECVVTGIYWEDTLRNGLFGRVVFEQKWNWGYMTVQVEQSTLYLIRYSTLCTILFVGLLYGTIRMFQTKISSERQNLARLIGAQFVVLVSLVIQLLVRPTIDIVPIFASLSILSVVVSMLTDGFFGVTDWGHEWVFQQMEDAYIIVDSLYGYLDANASAKAIFPGLERAKIGGNISKELQCIFSGENDKCEVGGRIYERKVSKIINRNKLAGYSMLLKDITEQQEHVNLIHSYNAKLEAEVEEKTRHLQLMQDSIITGMASVVESRDNSTGGHINRTSAVVKILAKKLMESPELAFEQAFLSNVIKVAPMHDLGKVAVDDVVLRKPGKFTDEEYAKMKTHSAEGARVLKKVLAEVEDTELVETAVNIAHYHHERWDGKGYPEGLEGENIPVEARIMALADVFDALVSKRCYKEAFTFDKAFSIIDEGLGTQFDPVLGKIFIDCRPELESLYMEMD